MEFPPPLENENCEKLQYIKSLSKSSTPNSSKGVPSSTFVNKADLNLYPKHITDSDNTHADSTAYLVPNCEVCRPWAMGVFGLVLDYHLVLSN